MQTDVSRVVGRVVIKYKDQDYILDNFGFDDWSVIQFWMVREKRARILQAAADVAAGMPKADADELRSMALRQCAEVTGLTPQEYDNVMSTEDGVSLFLWVMFERRYPGMFKKSTIYNMLMEKKISETEVEMITTSLLTAMGIDIAKKKTTPNDTNQP